MAIFTDWRPKYSALFGNQPLHLAHTLHQNPLFSRHAMAELIEKYPTEKYRLVHMGEQGSPKKLWRAGKIGNLSGHAVLEAIEHNRLWINLLHVHEVDRRYHNLLRDIYMELAARVPDHPPMYKLIAGILISSPRAQVYYHFDTAGQNLWQIAGTKKVYVYPPTEPFVTQQALENVMLYHGEVNIPYEPWYDNHAQVYDLQPGYMLHWPLNAPHRIENGNQLSVSLTTEFFTSKIRRHVWSTSGNGLLRQVGLKPKPTLYGPAYYAKVAVFAAAKKSGMLDRKREMPTEFMLDEMIPKPSASTEAAC